MPSINEELEHIIDEFGIRDNPEQERAVRIVGEHFILCSEEQLLMYLGGRAGTGKSYVIKVIIKLFKHCGYSDKLLVSAPTGCAAIFIEGYTIHALTFLPKSDYPLNHTELQNIWKTVKYLIIDKVSMIGALFLSQVSQQICQAKGWDPTN
jgi:ATP-dependent DNA helicase PIF1